MFPLNVRRDALHDLSIVQLLSAATNVIQLEIYKPLNEKLLSLQPDNKPQFIKVKKQNKNKAISTSDYHKAEPRKNPKTANNFQKHKS